MTTTFATTADFTTSRHASKGVIARIAAAVAAKMERAKTRHQYRQMLAIEDHMLRDIGVTRDDIRQALRELEG